MDSENEGRARAKPRLSFLLNDLQSPTNIGQCLRIAETYGVDVYVCDPRGVTMDLGKLQTIADYACGALQRSGFRAVPDVQALLCSHQGRVVATCLCPDAVRLPAFCFEPDDLVVFGNEYDGLGEEVLGLADARVYVPLPVACLPKPRSRMPIDPLRAHEVSRNGVPNLNVATTMGIVAYAHACWVEEHASPLRTSVTELASR